MPEICICAAWDTEEGVIVRGHRHNYCRDTAIAMGLHPKRDPDAQGFMTSNNRFVDRFVAMTLQKAARMRSARTYQLFEHDAKALFSEDLY